MQNNKYLKNYQYSKRQQFRNSYGMNDNNDTIDMVIKQINMAQRKSSCKVEQERLVIGNEGSKANKSEIPKVKGKESGK